MIADQPFPRVPEGAPGESAWQHRQVARTEDDQPADGAASARPRLPGPAGTWGPAWLGGAAVALTLAVLVIASFVARWRVLSASPFPIGIDGYFYPIQLRSLLATGHLAYPASPLAFWLMAPLAAATDPIVGAKLGAALFGALIALPAYGVGVQLGGRRVAGVAAAAVATWSAGSAFLTLEFVKNGIGLTVGLTALWLVLRAVEAPSRLRVAGALGGVVAAVLAHKMAGAIVIGIAIPAVIAQAGAGAGPRRGHLLGYAVGGLAVLVLGLVILGLAAPERFLSIGDVALVRELWGPASWEAPALSTPGVTLAMGHEALLGGGLAVVAAIVLIRRRRATSSPSLGTTAAAWTIIGLALVIALPWLAVTDPQGLGFRLRIAAFVPLALCAAIVVGALADLLRQRGELGQLGRVGPLGDVALGVVVLALVVATPRDRTEGEILAHPAMVAAVQGLVGRIPPGGTAIVPERHIAFMVTWYTGAPVRLRPEEIPPAQRWRVMPLAFIGLGSPLDDALLAARRMPGVTAPLGTHPRHPNGLVMVPEPTWDWALAQLPPDARAYFARWPTI